MFGNFDGSHKLQGLHGLEVVDIVFSFSSSETQTWLHKLGSRPKKSGAS